MLQWRTAQHALNFSRVDYQMVRISVSTKMLISPSSFIHDWFSYYYNSYMVQLTQNTYQQLSLLPIMLTKTYIEMADQTLAHEGLYIWKDLRDLHHTNVRHN